MTTKEFMEKIKKSSEVSLSLYNERGEYYSTNQIKTLTHTNKGIKIHWLAPNPFTHILPFTHAVIHRGKTILKVISIRPVASDVQPTEIVLEF